VVGRCETGGEVSLGTVLVGLMSHHIIGEWWGPVMMVGGCEGPRVVVAVSVLGIGGCCGMVV